MDAEVGTSRGDELEHLAMVIEAYEEKHHPIELPDPIAAIQFRMEQEGLSNKDLAPIPRRLGQGVRGIVGQTGPNPVDDTRAA